MNIETANNSESKQYKERLIIALKAAHVCIFEVDLTRQLYTFFENAEDIFGVSGQQILDDVQPFSKLSPCRISRGGVFLLFPSGRCRSD